MINNNLLFSINIYINIHSVPNYKTIRANYAIDLEVLFVKNVALENNWLYGMFTSINIAISCCWICEL